MKEIKVATLTKEEIKEANELRKMREKVDILMAQGISAQIAFWGKVRMEHNLTYGHHYVKNNSIYRQDVG